MQYNSSFLYLLYKIPIVPIFIAKALRESTLASFRKGKFKVLVATDVAARGLDMIVDLVINVEPPTTLNFGPTPRPMCIDRAEQEGLVERVYVSQCTPLDNVA